MLIPVCRYQSRSNLRTVNYLGYLRVTQGVPKGAKGVPGSPLGGITTLSAGGTHTLVCTRADGVGTLRGNP